MRIADSKPKSTGPPRARPVPSKEANLPEHGFGFFAGTRRIIGEIVYFKSGAGLLGLPSWQFFRILE